MREIEQCDDDKTVDATEVQILKYIIVKGKCEIETKQHTCINVDSYNSVF